MKTCLTIYVKYRCDGDRQLHGRGIGWIDVHLLASALVARLELWTTDPALATVAKELGIRYE